MVNKRAKKLFLLKQLFFALLPMILVFLANELVDSRFIRIYNTYPNFDVVMHTSGGIVSAWFLFSVLRIFAKKFKIALKPQWIENILLIGGVVVIAYAWELFEFLHDQFFPRHFQLGVGDTMKDLTCGILGAIFFCLVFRPWLLKRKK